MKRIIKERKFKFDEYRSELPEKDQLLLDDFFEELDRHLSLDRDDGLCMKTDFEAAIMYFDSIGLTLGETLARLDVKNLGGFYARPPIVWFQLDDVAKLYPLSMKHGQMAVFRLSAYLKEEVVPEVLQMALTFTIKRFPSFATTVKKGFFWHYLDTSKKRYPVEEEKYIPCRPMNVSGSGSQSFRVLYYGNRVSAEFFHILTDGTGGMVFLKTLLAEYLRLLGKLGADAAKTAEPVDYQILDINQMPPATELISSLPESDEVGKLTAFVDKPALQFSGKLSKLRMSKILHFKLDAAGLREAAREEGCTVTAYILTQLFIAGRYATDEYSGEMNIQVPVNLRQYYPSETMRNFFMCCGIRIPVETIDSACAAGRTAGAAATDNAAGRTAGAAATDNAAGRTAGAAATDNAAGRTAGAASGTDAADMAAADGTMNRLAAEVSAQLAEKASRKAISELMDTTQKLIKAVSYIPLAIKAPVCRITYGFLGDRVFSNTFSNLGVVSVSPEMEEHVESMDFILATTITNRASCTMVTFANTTTLTVSKMTEDPSFEEKLAELLERRGLLREIEGSELYEG